MITTNIPYNSAHSDLLVGVCLYIRVHSAQENNKLLRITCAVYGLWTVSIFLLSIRFAFYGAHSLKWKMKQCGMMVRQTISQPQQHVLNTNYACRV